ncbi:MAG: hypothetical protein K1X85_05800 [Ignavibacteria bacterium]|nr:hypothetical protein [Ignavibacteria bacterium]
MLLKKGLRTHALPIMLCCAIAVMHAAVPVTLNSQTLPSVSSLRSFKAHDRSESSNSSLAIGVGLASFLYLLNPIVLFQNDKIAGGLTKELSVGFGYFGEHRLAGEYSYVFRSDASSNLRFGYKYDILLKDRIRPSNFLQGTSCITLGASYFYDFNNHGVSPEIGYGYSIRNDKLLIYPNVKARYTYIPEGSDMFDFSFGLMIGIANPFTDLNIRNSNPTK